MESNLSLHYFIVYVGKPCIGRKSNAGIEMEGGGAVEEGRGSYIDEARGLLFSLLISLNLLIPILKPATLQCWRLLCVVPSLIKLSFIPVPFKHRSIH